MDVPWAFSSYLADRSRSVNKWYNNLDEMKYRPFWWPKIHHLQLQLCRSRIERSGQPEAVDVVAVVVLLQAVDR
jgi:hypothetical protein